MKIKILTLFILVTFLCVSCHKNDDEKKSIFEQENSLVDLSSFLSDYDVITIDVADLYQSLQNQTSKTKEFSLLDGRYNFKVSKSTIAQPQVFYVLNDSNEFEELPTAENGTLYLDNLDIQNTAGVTGMIIREQELYLEFEEEDEMFVVSALSELMPEAKSDEYIVYKQSAILESHDSGSNCHLEVDADSELKSENPNSSETRAAQYTVTNTVVIDYSMHNRLGWNGSINYVNDAMYMTNFRYSANSGLSIAIIKGSGYILNQSNQYGLAYSSSPTGYLNNYAAWLSSYGIGNDASILFTSDHAHWGAAYMNTVCGYYGVALVEYHSWTTRRYNIIAHELGHILGAGHTNSGVMRTVANGESSFTQYSKNQILNFLGSAGWCL